MPNDAEQSAPPPGGWRLVDALLRLALEEDIGPGDATTAALGTAGTRLRAVFSARQAGVMAGAAVLERLFGHLSRDGRLQDFGPSRVAWSRTLQDGAAFGAGGVLAEIAGPAAIVLAAERTALNLLQRMCGVAARTAQFVAEARRGAPPGRPAPAVLDTRKTCPGHRALDKWAVRAGGGQNHRLGLFDMILIKDNHLALAGGPGPAVRRARAAAPLPVMVEVDTLEQLAQALPAEPDYVLLDNMRPERLREAVALADGQCLARGWRRPRLEASGGIGLGQIAAVAATGVDRISAGALTQGAGAVDIGLDVS